MKGGFRTGSALLIVLGMLSFMVVSAVSFSIYMRQGRAPSSYLRRNLAARYLVRAALAKAIDDLEGQFNEDENWGKFELNETDVARRFYGVYDDPYPGRGTDSSYSIRQNGDCWLHRVFMPFGPVEYPEATVPTLTLEALAYLPPAIIDDVRVLSRMTRTAAWRSLPYESGRYAYTAVNVSDLFDINRLCAADPRDSGPHKVSLAPLFATDLAKPFDIDTGKAETFETLTHDRIASATIEGKAVPFVSLADFNLSFGNGSEFAPFMKYIGGTSLMLQNSGSSEAANAMFVTDSIFSAEPGGGDRPVTGADYDLAANQPFRIFNANSFLDVAATENKVGELLLKNLGIGYACLYDYLDRDQYPLSLCLPTTEAVPMVVGVSAPGGLKIDLGNIGQPETGSHQAEGYYVDPQSGEQVDTPVTVKRSCQRYGITGFGNNVMVRCLAAYPFKRMKTTDRKKDFKVRGIMRVWLAPDGMGCRPNGSILYPSKEDVGQAAASAKPYAKNGVVTFVSDDFVSAKTLSSFSTDVTTQDGALDTFDLQFRNLTVDMPIYWNVKEDVEQNMAGKQLFAKPANYKQSYSSMARMLAMDNALRPLSKDGNIDNAFSAAIKDASWDLSKPYPAGITEMTPLQFPYRLYMAVWVQVLLDGEVVDMVPACAADDVNWLGANAQMMGIRDVTNKTGDGAPLLNFECDKDIVFDDKIGDKLKEPGNPLWKSVYAADPRYNWAPEDWYASDVAEVSKDDWISRNREKYWGLDGRDRDIFMFVSDQEYLQSVGELQFLPYLQELRGDKVSNVASVFLKGDFAPNYHGEAFSARDKNVTANDKFANGWRFWRTYTAYNNGDGTDPVYALPDADHPNGIRVHSGLDAYRLNPYSDDDRVLFAALVGTPFDYYIASTNENSDVKRIQNITLEKMKEKYSFGSSSIAKLTNEEMLDISDRIRTEFQEKARTGNSDWEDAWETLSWQSVEQQNRGDDNKVFMGDVILSEALHGVDRKYLYSFWRECFGNAQQLYLIFVRAEPSSIGGGAAGNLTSSQLGGRAVALVWRDPAKPMRDDGSAWSGRKDRNQIGSKDDLMDVRRDTPPHRTRVLFYHQFD